MATVKFRSDVGGDVFQLVEFIQSDVVSKGVHGPMPESHRTARDYLAAKVGLPPLSGAGFKKEELEEVEALRSETEDTQNALTKVVVNYRISYRLCRKTSLAGLATIFQISSMPVSDFPT